MKKYMVIIFLFIGCIFAHKETTHQYITNEAYNLLKTALNYSIPEYDLHMHSQFDPAAGGPFQSPFITRGAYREDLEDPVYNIYMGNPPTMYDDVGGEVALFGETLGIIVQQLTGLNFDFFVSSTHFWKVDAGDNQLTKMYAQTLLRDFLYKSTKFLSKDSKVCKW